MPRPLTCPPEFFELNLKGNTYIVTGANSGIGFETTRQLARQGAQIVLACRDTNAAKRAISEIQQTQPDAQLQARKLDLGNLSSVRAFADEFLGEHETLTGLVNNAGIMNTPYWKTANGFESQLGVNHLGHFLLTELLTDLLKRSAPSRVVNVSSCFHDRAMGREGDIHFEDLHFESTKYDGWKAYAQSKLANVLHAQELARRLQGTGVTCVSVHPGWVRTRLVRNSAPVWVQNYVLRPALQALGMIEPWVGAQSTLYALLSPDVPQHPGAYFSQTGVYRDRSKYSGGWPLESPNPAAHDPQKAKRLWEVSQQLVGSSASYGEAAQ